MSFDYFIGMVCKIQSRLCFVIKHVHKLAHFSVFQCVEQNMDNNNNKYGLNLGNVIKRRKDLSSS